MTTKNKKKEERRAVKQQLRKEGLLYALEVFEVMEEELRKSKSATNDALNKLREIRSRKEAKEKY